MRLYLIRHGEAVLEEVDSKKPLSEKGQKDILKIGNYIKKENIKVSYIFHSGKTRAKQTAEIIDEIVSGNFNIVQKECLSPNDYPEFIIKEIYEINEDLMIVGHMPFLSRLLSKLIIGDHEKSIIGFKTGSMIILELDKNKNWKIINYITPGIL